MAASLCGGERGGGCVLTRTVQQRVGTVMLYAFPFASDYLHPLVWEAGATLAGFMSTYAPTCPRRQGGLVDGVDSPGNGGTQRLRCWATRRWKADCAACSLVERRMDWRRGTLSCRVSSFEFSDIVSDF